MAKIVRTAAQTVAHKIIGNRTLFGIRSGPQGKKVRMFVVSGKDDITDITDVTGIVARVCHKRISKDGWILAGNYGYCPVLGLAETYAAAMGKDGHPNRTL